MERMEISSARMAYVSTMAGKIIALPNCSGLLATRPILAAAALPCDAPEIQPTMPIGRHAARYKAPFIKERSALPPIIPICVSVMNAISSPYIPCVPGSSCKTRTLLNLLGSSVTTPAAT